MSEPVQNISQDKRSVFKSLSEKIKLKSSGWKTFVCFLVTGILIYGLYMLVCAPKRYDLKVGSIAHETITATKDVVDEVTTEEKKRTAANGVEPVYRFQDGIAESVVNDLDNVFSELRLVQQYGITLQDGTENPSGSFTDEEIEYANGFLHTISLTRYQIMTLLKTGTADFETMVSTVETAVANSMNATVREGQISQAIDNIKQIVGYRLDVSLNQNIVSTVLKTCIKPNMIIDQEATEQARSAASENVENVIYLQGQNIIRDGERVTLNQIEILRSLGLLKDNQYDFSIYGGAAILVLLSMVCLYILLKLLKTDVTRENRKLTVVLITTFLSVLFAVVCLKIFNAFFIPITMGTMLLTVLLGPEVGLASVIPISVLTAGLSAGSNSAYLAEMLLIFLMCSIGGVVSVRYLATRPMRTRLIIAGILCAVINVLIILAINVMTSSDLKASVENIAWACAGAVLSGILAMALQPVFESIFRLATATRLVELVNPDQPLLRRLLIEAPGTYHHSIVVANLAEAAAEKIGANSLLARAAAYYHDIGKLKRPQYFSENQMGTNPHDTTDPYISSAIITSHPSDGLYLAQQAHLPAEIQDIISQHHGDTATMYFYHKALQMANGSPIDINDFRYHEKKPSSKEAAIVMLADTVEAAVRSMKDPTPNAIEKFIERLIRGKLEDGQLTESPILICDLDDIVDAFTSVLKGVFHERIEYPKMTVQAQEAMQQLSQVIRQNAGKQSASNTAEKNETVPSSEKPPLEIKASAVPENPIKEGSEQN